MPSLALIFHLVDCVTHNTQGQVGLESAKQAVNWCEYLETHARRVYGLFDGMGNATSRSPFPKIENVPKPYCQN